MARKKITTDASKADLRLGDNLAMAFFAGGPRTAAQKAEVARNFRESTARHAAKEAADSARVRQMTTAQMADHIMTATSTTLDRAVAAAFSRLPQAEQDKARAAARRRASSPAASGTGNS